MKVARGVRPNEVAVTGVTGGQVFGVEIFAHGTSTAFADLGAGASDIGMASRQIKDEEQRKLSVLGDWRSYDSEHVIGLDGIAIIVNTAIRLRSCLRVPGCTRGQWHPGVRNVRGPRGWLV